jgi:DNA repair protein SbcC/Rad50
MQRRPQASPPRTMLNKLFKKDSPIAAKDTSSNAASKPKAAKVAKPKPDDALVQAWQEKVTAAAGNDEALLAIARETPILAVKAAAVAALQTEEALKAAEREFRQHDRRIHRDVKQRLDTLIASRKAREDADVLIAQLRALAAEESIPANKLVEVDRAWHALDTSLLDEERRNAFNAAEEAISQILRSRGDKQVTGKRWLAKADEAETKLRAACQQAATGATDDETRAHLGAAHDAAFALWNEAFDTSDESPISRDITHKKISLEAAIQLARVIDVRLNFLSKLNATQSTEGNAETNEGGLNAEWHALPAVPDADAALALNARFDAWRQMQQQRHDTQAAAHAKMTEEERKAALAATRELLTGLITKAETSLAAGNVIEASAQLAGIDEALKSSASTATSGHAVSHTASKGQHAKIEQLRAEITRLRGWQQWGGGRVRDDLVEEAEALAKASSAEKLSLKTHADAIENLRERWKELDKLGGATNRGLWLRFDGALKTAYLPVAANLAKLKEARQDNLAKRNALIAELDKAALPQTQDIHPDWRSVTRALDHFETEWRKLGPVEHTVPHKSREALLEKKRAAEARLETPLNDARRVEALKREKIIARAKALANEAKKPDAVNKVKALQEEWQQHAKALPLQRNVENKLWADFKTATDAIFAERKAEFAARDAALASNQTAREELINRLADLNEDTPPADIRKILNEVDNAWRKAGEAPRNVAAKLDARFRQVRSHAQELASSSQQRSWSKVVDALDARRAALRDAETNPGTLNDDWQATWASLPAVPKPWQAALDKRVDAIKAGGTAALNADDVLLKLESALDIASPPAYRAARMALKLQAMKNAIEARSHAGTSAAELDAMFADALAKTPFGGEAESRLVAIINVVRKKPLVQ